MKTLEVVVIAVAFVVLAVGWRRGWTGHRTCRLIHMQLSGRTSDVAFQPTGWHPRDSKGHPKSPEDGSLQQPTCRKVMAATKTAVILLGVIFALGLWKARAAALAGLAGGDLAAIGLTIRYLIWRLHRISVTRPQASPLASVLSYHLRLGAADLADGMTVGEDGVVERIEVPSTFLSFDRNQDEVNAILAERLPLQQAQWHLDASYPYIDLPFRLALPRPSDVRWRDLLPAIEACSRGEYVIGVDTDGPYELSFRRHPHHAWSFATGRGKSTLLRCAVTQILAQHEQNRVVCLDTKRVSLEPIAGIPRLTYLIDPGNVARMVRAIEVIKAEMDARYVRRTRGARRFPMLLLVLEEAADLDKAVSQWWARTRQRSQPAVPPVWADSLASILRQGREVEVHVLIVTQDFDDRAYSGVGLRNNFELIAMSGWRPQQWSKCIGTTPVPRPEPGPGRMVVCHGNIQHPVQGMSAEPGELLAYAAGQEMPS